ncbi:hypothetical protein niasHT_015050 [Heterodera trifolii]|uniref:Uncharacterized protein n=1 Tax=Heterodera trifolii TaxID=157864 RepID=A0ABD2LAB4_9BILA
MARFVGIALLSLTIASMELAKADKSETADVVEGFRNMNIGDNNKGCPWCLLLILQELPWPSHPRTDPCSVDGITKKLAETEIDSKSKGAHGKEPAADKATKKGKALKTTTSSVAANEWDDQLMGMSVEKFNEELAVLLPKANLFMENALSFINEQMTNNGIGIGAAGGSCSAGIPAN